MTVAFPRSPMVLAYAAWDLARFSGGRFQLGVATQVRGNIVGRFSVPWHDPAGRLARLPGRAAGDLRRLRRPRFVGTSRRATTPSTGSQPFFNPGPLPVGRAAAVDRRGQPADLPGGRGSRRRIRQSRHQLSPPGVGRAGAARRSGRASPPPGGPMAAPASWWCRAASPDRTRPRSPRAAATARKEFAFLYSTPAYRRSLELLGRTDVGERPVRPGQARQLGRSPERTAHRGVGHPGAARNLDRAAGDPARLVRRPLRRAGHPRAGRVGRRRRTRSPLPRSAGPGAADPDQGSGDRAGPG